MSDFLDKAIPFAVNVATAATHAIIAASAGNRHRVFRLLLKANGNVTVTIQSGSTVLMGPTAMTAAHPPLEFLMNGGPSPQPWFITASGEAFNLVLSDAVQVSGVGLASTG